MAINGYLLELFKSCSHILTIVKNLSCQEWLRNYHILVAYQLSKKKIKDLIQSTFNQKKTRGVFISNQILRLKLKDPISHLDKNCVVHRLN